MASRCLISLLFVLLSLPVGAETIRFVTWNIANLHHETGIPLKHYAMAREEEDYRRLQEIATNLQADIFALQEIGSLQALARIFPPDQYHLFISDRYRSGIEHQSSSQRGIYTAFAVAKGRFQIAPMVETLHGLSIAHLSMRKGKIHSNPTRAGLVMGLTIAGKQVRFLNIHLKSFCHQWPLQPVYDENQTSGADYRRRFDCRTLAAQLAILENWIELQVAADHNVIVAGDFNRRLNLWNRKTDRPDIFWAELNDGAPNKLNLVKGPTDRDTVCWPNHKKRYPEHIDFFVFDERLVGDGASVEINKYGLGFEDEPGYADRARQRLSDHCPVIMDLMH